MRLTLIRNATLRIDYAESTLLFDPYLASQGQGNSYAGKERSPLVDLPWPLERVLHGISGVLISHLHSDHFDETAKAVVPKALPVLCHPRDATQIGAAGFTRLLPFADAMTWQGISFEAVGGQHGPKEVLGDLGDVCGFILRHSSEPTLYLAGDTIWYGEVADTIARAHPDVIVVHAAGATWKGHGPIVMDAHHVQQVLTSASRATVVATHLDCVDHATETRTSLAAAAAAWPNRGRLLIPNDGETLEIVASQRSAAGAE